MVYMPNKGGRAQMIMPHKHVLFFMAETNLFDYYNRKFLDGRWDHFMDQGIIGYRNWADPRRNTMNAIQLTTLDIPDAAGMGVAVDGSVTALTNGEATLPQFDAFNQQKYYIDVFNQGKTDFDFTATASDPWIRISDSYRTNPKRASLGAKRTSVCGSAWIGIRLQKRRGVEPLRSPARADEVTVKVNAFNPADLTRDSLHGFAEGDGYVSIEPEHLFEKTDSGANRWIKIEDYGRTLSGMRATGPANAPAAVPGKDSPSLEYKMYLFRSGRWTWPQSLRPF